MADAVVVTIRSTGGFPVARVEARLIGAGDVELICNCGGIGVMSPPGTWMCPGCGHGVEVTLPSLEAPFLEDESDG